MLRDFWTVAGEMGTFVRSHDWSNTPIGSLVTWSVELKTTISIVLSNRLPMSVLWGDDLLQIYNAPYQEFWGDRHPCRLGQPYRDCWADSWATLEPVLLSVLETGKATQLDHQLFGGKTGSCKEQRHATFSYAPLWENDRIRGILVTIVALGDTHASAHKQEQCHAEIALQKQEERLRLIIDAIPVLVSYVDADQRYRFNNKAYEDWFGHSAAEIYGKHIRDVVGEAAYRLLRPRIETVLSGQEVTYEQEVPYKDAGTRYISVVSTPDINPQGEVKGYITLVTDITNYKRLETDLRRSEARIRRLVDSNMVGVIFADFQGNISEVNDAFLAIVGYTREDVPAGNLRWLEMTPPEWLAQDQQVIAEIRQTGACGPFEKEYFRKDGSRVPILIGAALLPDSDDECVCFVVDLTDRNRAEAILWESEARFRHMTDTSPIMVWMSGTDKRRNYVNQSWLNFTGRTIQQELGNGWTEGIHPDDFERCLHIYTTAFDARQPVEMDYRLSHASGEYRSIVDLGVPRFTAQGDFLGYIGSCFDIHDRVQAEAQMRQMNEILEQRVKERTAQLEAANRELEAFSYSVSHDLRAPLRHIDGFTDLLRKRLAEADLDETSQRYLNTISQTTKQAGILIDDLLAFSRMGRTEMRSLQINMNQLVQEVCKEIEQETKGQPIHWQVEPLPTVRGDLAMLRQVVRNLLNNAVKYSRSRPYTEIAIGSISDPQEDVFFVRDNGIGFNMQYSHKLFGIFQRLHSDPQFEGTGIGLANVQRIIHRHGGRTWAEGVVDGGATFYFTLPKLTDQQSLPGGQETTNP